MADINFSFGFKKYPLANGGEIQRPVFTVTLANGREKLDTWALLDSGADFSMMPRELAEGLGIEVDSCDKKTASSASGTHEVAIHEIVVTIKSKGKEDSFKADFQIPVNSPGHPPIVLLGREPLFQRYDVSFRMGYTSELGKFVLRRQTKKRDPSNYKVGGMPLRDARVGPPG